MNAAGKVLWSQIRRHSRRFDLWIIRGVVLLAAIGLYQTQGPIPLSSYALLVPVGVTSLFLSGWLAGDLVETRQRSFLDLLRLSELEPLPWHLVNLALGYLKYFWVVSVRWPVWFALWYIGRITAFDLLIVESGALLVFLLSFNVWLDSGWKWNVQRFVLSFLAIGYPISIDHFAYRFASTSFNLPAAIAPLWEGISEVIHSLSLCSHYLGESPLLALSPLPIGPAVWYGMISFLSARSLQRSLRIGWYAGWPDWEAAGQASGRKITIALGTPPENVVWPDALAWHVVHVHSQNLNRPGRWVLVAAVVLGLGAAYVFAGKEWFWDLAPFICLAAAASPAMTLAAAFTQELQGRTLSSLVLAAGGEKAIYQAWNRGVRWLTVPEITFFTIVCLILSWKSSGLGLIMFCVCVSVWLCTPTAAVGSLIPFTCVRGGIDAATILVLFLGLFVAAAWIIADVVKSPLAAPALIPLSYVFNQIVLKLYYSRWFYERMNEA